MLGTYSNEKFKIDVYGTKITPYFKAKEIATILKYKNTKDAIIRHVDKEDRVTFDKIPNFESPTPSPQTRPHKN